MLSNKIMKSIAELESKKVAAEAAADESRNKLEKALSRIELLRVEQAEAVNSGDVEAVRAFNTEIEQAREEATALRQIAAASRNSTGVTAEEIGEVWQAIVAEYNPQADKQLEKLRELEQEYYKLYLQMAEDRAPVNACRNRLRALFPKNMAEYQKIGYIKTIDIHAPKGPREQFNLFSRCFAKVDNSDITKLNYRFTLNP